MKNRILIAIQEWLLKRSSTPWACFETSGVDADGRIPMIMHWNKAFYENLVRHGYQGTTEEETIQLFFIASQMLPADGLAGDSVNPGATPNLTNEANTLRR